MWKKLIGGLSLVTYRICRRPKGFFFKWFTFFTVALGRHNKNCTQCTFSLWAMVLFSGFNHFVWAPLARIKKIKNPDLLVCLSKNNLKKSRFFLKKSQKFNNLSILKPYLKHKNILIRTMKLYFFRIHRFNMAGAAMYDCSNGSNLNILTIFFSRFSISSVICIFLSLAMSSWLVMSSWRYFCRWFATKTKN